MKSNKEILDKFGEMVIKDVFDTGLSITKYEIAAFENTDGYKNLFKKMTPDAKKEFDKIIRDILDGAVFNFLKVFEEHEEFKILYEEKGRQINLVEISEMLKAEPIIENGWIERFSEYGKKDKT